jgi:hypothetical protein
MKVMGLMRADADTEAGVIPSADLFARMDAFMEEVNKAGVLLASDGLKPTSQGKRIALADGKLTVTDGPFTESRELIASYALMEVESMDDAVYWTRRFLEVLGRGECELRPILDFSDFPQDLFPPEAVAQERTMREEMRARADQGR